MTEFKKVELLLDSLFDELKCMQTAMELPAPATTTWAHWHKKLLSGAADVFRRTLKLRSKATETDPNKQIYNEVMCQRILDLWERVLTFLREGLGVDASECMPLDIERCLEGGAALQTCWRYHEEYVVHKSRSEEWVASHALTMAGTVQREEEERTLLGIEWRQGVEATKQLLQADRISIRAAEEERDRIRWETEMTRRKDELRRFPAVAALLVTLEDHLHQPQWLLLGRRLLDLFKEVLANPERIGVRIVRHTAVAIGHFGHPAVSIPVTRGGCSCAEMNTFAEGIMCTVGYRPSYGGKPSFNSVVSGWFSQPAHDRSGAPRSLPCGATVEAHEYHAIGYESYGERTLQLGEPDPSVDAEGWCQWHESLHALVAQLDGLVTR